MKATYFIYLSTMIMSAFAVSGINFDYFIKKNHVWEARFLAILLITGLSYLSGSLIISLIGI